MLCAPSAGGAQHKCPIHHNRPESFSGVSAPTSGRVGPEVARSLARVRFALVAMHKRVRVRSGRKRARTRTWKLKLGRSHLRANALGFAEAQSRQLDLNLFGANSANDFVVFVGIVAHSLALIALAAKSQTQSPFCRRRWKRPLTCAKRLHSSASRPRLIGDAISLSLIASVHWTELLSAPNGAASSLCRSIRSRRSIAQ